MCTIMNIFHSRVCQGFRKDVVRSCQSKIQSHEKARSSLNEVSWKDLRIVINGNARICYCSPFLSLSYVGIARAVHRRGQLNIFIPSKKQTTVNSYLEHLVTGLLAARL
jgi:hypothetical protein